MTGFWLWLKSKYGFTDSQVRSYNFNPGPFLANKRVVQQGYVTSEPYTIETVAGFKPSVFLLADEGYPGYAAMIMAADSLIAAKPDAVRAFVEATAAGWDSYLNGDPAPGDALIRQDNPDMTQDLLDHGRAMIKAHGLVQSGDAEAGDVGAMTDARWEAFFKAASAQGVYPADMDWRRAYTLQFLKQP